MNPPPQSPKRVSQRQPRACLECTRRKTRCDKAIPCGRCVRLSKPCSREVVRVTKIERNHGSELAFLHSLCGILKSSGNMEALAAIQERRSALLHGKGPEMFDNTSSTSSPDRDLNHDVEAGETACSPARPLRVTRGLGEEHGEENGDVPDSDSTEHQDTDKDQHAANFLRIELLAWGRHGGACFPHGDCDCRSIRPYSEIASIIADPEWNGCRYDIPDLSSLPIFLPDTQARASILFHFDNILWHHNVFHAPTFLTQCEHFWTTGTVIHPLWISVYYSVIAVSAWTALNCKGLWTGEDIDPDLPQHSFTAMVDQLYKQDFAQNHSIFSLQAIVLSTRVAHNLGRSDLNATLVGAAIRMAQCMGLHRIQTSDNPPPVDMANGWFRCVETEIGRRCWNQLVIQDYFQIPVTETCAIYPSQATTERPINCHDEDMVAQKEDIPTINSYPRALARIAEVMPQLLHGLPPNRPRRSLAETYGVIAGCASTLRDVLRDLPSFFMDTAGSQSIDDVYMPHWLSFARRSLALSVADKLIMIHRPVLYHAFQVSTLMEARKSCVAAGKAIFKEFQSISDEGDVPIWTHSAFCVTAAVVIGLELLFRESHTDDEASHLRFIMNNAAGLLRSRQSDIIAARCAALIDTILAVEEELVVSVMRLSLSGATSQLRGAQIDMVNKMVEGNEIMAKFLIYRPESLTPQSQSSFAMDEFLEQGQTDPHYTDSGFLYPNDGDFAFMYIS